MPPGYIEIERRKLLERLTKKAEDARHERDVAIMEAIEAGISSQVIGKVTNMAHSSARDIARRKRLELDGKPITTRRAAAVPGRRPPPPPPRYGWGDEPTPEGWEKLPPKGPPPHNR